MVSVIVIIALVVTGGAGVSVVADNSLPGDALYAVKININEGFRSALAVGAEAEARLAAKLADRRLQEAEQLAVRGRLNAETAMVIKERFAVHVSTVVESTADLEAKSDFVAVTDVNSAFEANLRAHERVLLRMQGEAAVQAEIQALLDLVRDNVSTASAASARAENSIAAQGGAEVEAAARGKLTAAENKVSEAQSFIAKIKSRASASVTAEAEARLEVAVNTIAAGKVKLDASAYGEAFAQFQKAIRIASEAQILAAARGALGVDVGADGSVRVGGGAPPAAPPAEGGVGVEGEADADVEAGAGSGGVEVEGDIEGGLEVDL